MRKTITHVSSAVSRPSHTRMFIRPTMSPKNGMSSSSGTVTLGARGIVSGVPWVP